MSKSTCGKTGLLLNVNSGVVSLPLPEQCQKSQPKQKTNKIQSHNAKCSSFDKKNHSLYKDLKLNKKRQSLDDYIEMTEMLELSLKQMCF